MIFKLTKDERYMKLALRLALKGKGKTSPNPIVGAVVAKNDKIVGRGYHQRAGSPHAEIIALHQAGANSKGATLYVTLEPCSFSGRTPPCVDTIVNKGIKRVVVAVKDPNPLSDGRGFRLLKSRGIEVEVGILEDEAKSANEVFFKFIVQRLPFVTVKAAQTLDGKIATLTGDSKWVTDRSARDYVHILRNQVDAILVGVGTVLRDDPLLTCRLSRRLLQAEPNPRSPIKVVLDSYLKIPLTSRILSNKSPSPTIIATTKFASKRKIKTLEDKGVKILVVKDKGKRVDLKRLMNELGKMSIGSLLVEGGGEVIASAFQSKIVDKVLFFIAPKIVGGRMALTSVEGDGIKSIDRAIKVKEVKIKRLGEDILIEGYPTY